MSTTWKVSYRLNGKLGAFSKAACAWLYLRVSVDLTAEGSAATLALAPAPVRQ